MDEKPLRAVACPWEPGIRGDGVVKATCDADCRAALLQLSQGDPRAFLEYMATSADSPDPATLEAIRRGFARGLDQAAQAVTKSYLPQQIDAFLEEILRADR